MNSVFADSFYFFALVNSNEATHAKAVAFANSFAGSVVTTGWVLTEVADGLSRPGNRELFLEMRQEILTHPSVRVVGFSDDMFERGLKLYSERLDKDWSLTDCISFVVMQDLMIRESLTGDHHFEQAGFTALFK
jgi:predicted nucleic acid-binding protein